MKVVALSIDGDDQVRTQVFANERDLFEHLRVNYATDLDVDPGTPEGQKEIHDELEFQRLAYKWDWHEIPLQVEIIHGRNPDYSCEHTVFVNGEPSRDYYLASLDPGAGGYTHDDWKRETRSVEEGEAQYGALTEGFRHALVRERESFNDNSYLED